MIIELSYASASNRDAEVIADISQIVLGTVTASGNSATNLNADSSTIHGTLWSNPSSVYATHSYGSLSFTKKHYEDGVTGHWFLVSENGSAINIGVADDSSDSTNEYSWLYSGYPTGHSYTLNQDTLEITIVVTQKLFVIDINGYTMGIMDLIANGVNVAFPQTSKIASFYYYSTTEIVSMPKVYNARNKKYEQIDFNLLSSNSGYIWSVNPGPTPTPVAREIHIATGNSSIGAMEIGRWQPWGIKSIYRSPIFSKVILTDTNNKPFFAIGLEAPTGISNFSSTQGNNQGGGQIIIEGEL